MQDGHFNALHATNFSIVGCLGSNLSLETGCPELFQVFLSPSSYIPV